MKKIHSYSLVLGLIAGFAIANFFSAPPRAFAADEKKDALSQEEIDKRLDAILQSQKDIHARIEKIKEQAQSAKAAAGR